MIRLLLAATLLCGPAWAQTPAPVLSPPDHRCVWLPLTMTEKDGQTICSQCGTEWVSTVPGSCTANNQGTKQ